jgi:hypothetical protein
VITRNSGYQDWDDTNTRYAFQHELGHWVGIHEQYDDDATGLCTSVGPTVMNAASSGGSHCQGITGPQAWDVTKAQAFWTGESLGSLSFQETTPTSRVLQIDWKDRYWAESDQFAWLWRWTLVGQQWQWVIVQPAEKWYRNGIGFHQDSLDRTMVWQWDLQQLGQSFPAYFIGYVSAYTVRNSQWSSWYCDPDWYVYVD